MVHTILTNLVQPLAFIVSLHPGALPSEKLLNALLLDHCSFRSTSPILVIWYMMETDLYAYDGHLELPGQELQIPRTI